MAIVFQNILPGGILPFGLLGQLLIAGLLGYLGLRALNPAAERGPQDAAERAGQRAPGAGPRARDDQAHGDANDHTEDGRGRDLLAPAPAEPAAQPGKGAEQDAQAEPDDKTEEGPADYRAGATPVYEA